MKNSFKLNKHQIMRFREYEYHAFEGFDGEGNDLHIMCRRTNIPNLFGLMDEIEVNRVECINEIMNMDWYFLNGILTTIGGIKFTTYLEGFKTDLELYNVEVE